jgi:hypothetical protein
MPGVHINSVERLRDSVVVEFSDGSVFAYESEYLYLHRHEAKLVALESGSSTRKPSLLEWVPMLDALIPRIRAAASRKSWRARSLVLARLPG